jgi:hypothetical protein
MTSRFQDLDDLVLRLKGLILVRDIRKRAQADDEELELYSAEIARARDRLADLFRTDRRVGHPAA